MQSDDDYETGVVNRILEIIKSNEKGVTERILNLSVPDIVATLRAKSINKLLSENEIEIFKQGDQLLYKAKGKEAEKPGAANVEEKIVYSIIEGAGNKGIWIRDIAKKSNLPQAVLTKIIKAMESKKLIKSVKSVSASRHKSYILFEIEPDVTVTGGSFYSNQDFESEFVDILNSQTYKFLTEKLDNTCTDPVARKNKSYASSKEVTKYIKDLGISKVELSCGDIECILETLVFDGKVEKHSTIIQNEELKKEKITYYRATKPLVQRTTFSSIPCGVCPVMKDCHEGGLISPLNMFLF